MMWIELRKMVDKIAVSVLPTFVRHFGIFGTHYTIQCKLYGNLQTFLVWYIFGNPHVLYNWQWFHG